MNQTLLHCFFCHMSQTTGSPKYFKIKILSLDMIEKSTFVYLIIRVSHLIYTVVGPLMFCLSKTSRPSSSIHSRGLSLYLDNKCNCLNIIFTHKPLSPLVASKLQVVDIDAVSVKQLMQELFKDFFVSVLFYFGEDKPFRKLKRTDHYFWCVDVAKPLSFEHPLLCSMLLWTVQRAISESAQWVRPQAQTSKCVNTLFV